jgi:hypothetical protein
MKKIISIKEKRVAFFIDGTEVASEKPQRQEPREECLITSAQIQKKADPIAQNIGDTYITSLWSLFPDDNKVIQGVAEAAVSQLTRKKEKTATAAYRRYIKARQQEVKTQVENYFNTHPSEDSVFKVTVTKSVKRRVQAYLDLRIKHNFLTYAQQAVEAT